MPRSPRTTLAAQAQLQQQDQALTGLINRLDSRLTDLRIVLQGSRPLEVMQLAYTPLAPTFPKWAVTLPAGAAAGLVLGLLVSLAIALPGRAKAAV